MMYRPNPDCPRIARAGPDRAMTRRWIRRRVILTILLVMARSFGGVTRSAGWEPARAGHDVATGAGQGRVESRTRLARDHGQRTCGRECAGATPLPPELRTRLPPELRAWWPPELRARNCGAAAVRRAH